MLALWSLHCQPKNRHYGDDSNDSLLPKSAVFCGTWLRDHASSCMVYLYSVRLPIAGGRIIFRPQQRACARIPVENGCTDSIRQQKAFLSAQNVPIVQNAAYECRSVAIRITHPVLTRWIAPQLRSSLWVRHHCGSCHHCRSLHTPTRATETQQRDFSNQESA